MVVPCRTRQTGCSLRSDSNCEHVARGCRIVFSASSALSSPCHPRGRGIGLVSPRHLSAPLFVFPITPSLSLCCRSSGTGGAVRSGRRAGTTTLLNGCPDIPSGQLAGVVLVRLNERGCALSVVNCRGIRGRGSRLCRGVWTCYIRVLLVLDRRRRGKGGIRCKASTRIKL